MRRRFRSAPVALALALVLLAIMLLPARASNATIPVDGPGSLAIPPSAVPAGYAVDTGRSNAITGQSLLPTFGKHASTLLQRDGWATGYHGWLNANDLTYRAFVTYDFYGFKTASGAAAATGLLLGLALGVQTPTGQAKLPDTAQVFVDSSGSFGPEQKPFVAVEVIFRDQNVLADVTGYYEGGDIATIDAATSGSIDAAASIANWLTQRAGNATTSLLPLIVAPVGIAGTWRGRRRP